MLTAKDWGIINDLVCNMFSKEDINVVIKDFFNSFKQLVPYDRAAFDYEYIENPIKNFFRHEVLYNFKEKDSINFKENYSISNYTRWACLETKNVVYKETDIIQDSIRENTQIYLHFYKPLGIHYIAAASITFKDSILGFITLYRRNEQSDFSRKELEILRIISAHLSNRLNIHNSSLNPYLIIPSSLQEKLSNREIEIVQLIVKGLTNNEISEKLFISPLTVTKHLDHIYKKLNINSKLQLIQKLITRDHM